MMSDCDKYLIHSGLRKSPSPLSAWITPGVERCSEIISSITEYAFGKVFIFSLNASNLTLTAFVVFSKFFEASSTTFDRAMEAWNTRTNLQDHREHGISKL